MPLLNLPEKNSGNDAPPGVVIGGAAPAPAPTNNTAANDTGNGTNLGQPMGNPPTEPVATTQVAEVTTPNPTVTNPVNNAQPNQAVSIDSQSDIADNLNSNIAQVGASPSPAPEATQQEPAPQQIPASEQAQPAAQSATQAQPDDQGQLTPPSQIQTNEKDFTLQELLQEALNNEASDIHLSVGNRGILRIDGELTRMRTKILTPEYMSSIVDELLKDRPEVVKDEISQFDMGYDMNKSRFRVNIFKQRGDFTVVARLVPSEIKTVDQLGLPSILKDLGEISGGLILVTGPTGSGKSTTLASILNHINMSMTKHIITVEDPIEFIFPKGNCLINQRESGLDFTDWPSALKSILRQDPDIVLVGEMRDLETISSAITLSETGHLVFATLHTNSASQTMDRIIDVFPEGQQAQIRAQLANVISAVIAQRLVPLTAGGRTAVLEIMLANPAVRNTIREGKTHQIDNMISTGQDMGMVSMARALVELVNQGQLSADTARSFAPNLEEFNSLIGGAS